MSKRTLTMDQELADAIQRVCGTMAEGILLQNWCLVSDWEAADGTRGVHLMYPDNQPPYISRALTNEALTMIDADQDPVEDEE